MPRIISARLRPLTSHLGTPFGPDRFKTAISTARINSSMIREVIRALNRSIKRAIFGDNAQAADDEGVMAEPAIAAPL
jgi:hypothetical protein